MLIRITLIALFIVQLGCVSERPFPEAGPIYAAALLELAPEAAHYTVQIEKVETVETVEPGMSMESLDLDTLREHGDFSFPKLSDYLTEQDFPGLDPTLIDGSDLARLDADDCEEFWRNFRIAYSPSTGYFRFSEVGFDQPRTRAVFYMSGSGGCLASSGILVLMELVEGRWTVAGKRHLWVA